MIHLLLAYYIVFTTAHIIMEIVFGMQKVGDRTHALY